MSEDEIKAALSIEVEECSDMCGSWTETRLLWSSEVISTGYTNSVPHDE